MRAKQPGTALGIVMLAAALPVPAGAQQNAAPQAAAPSATVEIDDNDIGGVVTSRFGPEAGGNKCPEGFAFYPIPGPGFQGDPGAEENPYYTWVDQHDILGLGANTPLTTGNQSDSLHALVGGRVIELRIPYPMGFFAKGLDGRIDDANAGWKGRGLWATSGNRTPVHIEGIDAPAPGAPGTTPETASSPLVVHFQLRPNPLAH